MMAVLIALGTMNLAWMLALSVLIFLEKNAPGGARIAVLGAVVFALAGMALLFDPGLLTHLD
jgi:predicted metal-binding membrane protein